MFGRASEEVIAERKVIELYKQNSNRLKGEGDVINKDRR